MRDGWCIVRGAQPRATIAALAQDLQATFDVTPFARVTFTVIGQNGSGACSGDQLTHQT